MNEKKENTPTEQYHTGSDTERTNIINGSAQEDQLDKLKHGLKTETDDSGSKPVKHVEQGEENDTNDAP
jgi:hypothetical protein